MTIQFQPVALADIEEAVRQHLTSLPFYLDSYVEDQMMVSDHYQILLDASIAGFTSIHKGSLIVQYALMPANKHEGQRVYREIKHLANVQAALVPTYDEFFLSHAIDEYRQILKGGYLFAASPNPSEQISPTPFTLRLAELTDIETIKAGSGDFFSDLETHVNKRELFLTFLEKSCVGFGIMDRGELAGPVASIGMFILEQHRRQGAGTATIRLLQNECRREGLRPIAGCWYYNHLSKKTLERAGMYTQTRLLRIEY